MSSKNNTRFHWWAFPQSKRIWLEAFLQGIWQYLYINLKQGYGFVEFDNTRDACNAVYEMNNQSLCGEFLQWLGRWPLWGRRGSYGGRRRGYNVHYRGSFKDRHRSKYSRASTTKYKLIVENVLFRQDLKDLFRPVAEVTYSEANQDDGGKGIYEHHSEQDLNKAMDKLD